MISSTGQRDVTCTYTDVAASPKTHSYSSIPCQGSPTWKISWGYDAPGDFAVMTVVDTVLQQDAFFGYNSVATATAFEDKGPNPVYQIA